MLRANILIIDESRLVSKKVLDTVLLPFLNVNRTPPYLQNPKYKHLVEDNKLISITSSWFKNHHLWDSCKSYLKDMINGKDSFVAILNYELSMYHNLLSRKFIEQQMTKDDFDQTTFDMEYDALFIGENENAYFKLDTIQQCRTLSKPFIPPLDYEWLEAKGNIRKITNMPKQMGEIRLVSMDIAMMGNRKGRVNDTTVFTCIRMLPQSGEYRRDLVYLENMVGANADVQAIRLKQLYYDFEADYIAMDTNGIGISVFDACTKILYDKERDIEYPSFTAINNEHMDARKVEANAIPVIYSIKANAEINHKVATSLRSALEKQRLRLLMNDIEAKEELIQSKGYMRKSEDEKVRLLKPFVQTTALQNELVNLIYKVNNGYIKIEEVGTTTKDRYSSIGYGNYVASLIENDILRTNLEGSEMLDYCMF